MSVNESMYTDWERKQMTELQERLAVAVSNVPRAAMTPSEIVELFKDCELFMKHLLEVSKTYTN